MTVMTADTVQCILQITCRKVNNYKVRGFETAHGRHVGQVRGQGMPAGKTSDEMPARKTTDVVVVVQHQPPFKHLRYHIAVMYGVFVAVFTVPNQSENGYNNLIWV